MNIKKIREALELSRKVGVKMEWDDVRDRCEEALAELDKVQQCAEPVAWMHEKTKDTQSDEWVRYWRLEGLKYPKGANADGYTIPLYAHPPQAQQPVKVLTDEEIERVANTQFTHATSYSVYVQRESWKIALRYARDNDYLAPAAGPSDERPWMNEWQRNMCKKSKASLINIIEEERDENDRLRNLAPAAGLTVDEAMQAVRDWYAPWDCTNNIWDDLRARLNEKLNTKNQ